MNTKWIDFKALRAKLDFGDVLRHYGVEVKNQGAQHHGFCPLPNHNGKRNSPSFSVNLERGIFQCFGCGAKGNTLEFAALMEKVDPKDGGALRGVAMRLQGLFCPEAEAEPTRSQEKSPKASTLPGPVNNTTIIVNAPLDFALKDLDHAHRYPLSRGFTAETMVHFGVGVCSRGLLKNRLAIPLHDMQGRLIGYAGRIIDDNNISEDNPRYKFPGKRERDGKLFEFRKARVLYNAFRIKAPVDDLIVVEGFTSVWWLNQIGLPNTVATMGADPSDRQAELIIALVKPAGRVWIAPDGDAAGERHARTLLSVLSPHRLVRWVRLPDGKQPTDFSREQMSSFFRS